LAQASSHVYPLNEVGPYSTSMRWFCLLAGPAFALAAARGRLSPSAAVQGVQQQLQAAGEKDAAAHDKAGCFCQRNLEEKQQTVESMQEQLTGLSHDIDEQTAKIAQLDVEVKLHQEEVESSSHALSTAEAIRESDKQKFSEDEQTHVQSIDQLQGALSALKDHHSADLALNAMSEVFRRNSGLAFIQQQRRLRNGASNSPAVVSGVMQRMLTSFSGNLQKMRDDETEAKSRHEGLVSAKGNEIHSQKKQLMEKNQRLAKAKVAISFKTQIKPRSEKLLEQNMQLLGTLKEICQHSDESFQARRDLLQAETTALAEAQTEIAGAQLLSVSSTSGGDDGAEMLCATAPELQEKDWRQQAQAACKQARQGSKQAAAEAIESLETDIREAENEAARKQDDCTQEIRGAQADSSLANKEESAETNFVESTQKDSEDQIQALTSQSDNAVKAKADYQQVLQVEKEAFQALRVAQARGKDMLNAAANHAGGKEAASKIAEAIAQSEKMMAAVDDYSAASDSEAQKLASLLDSVQLAAGKAIIPLRLMKADSEESAINIKEESESRAHARKPQCNAVELSAEVARFKGYRAKLGRAAEGLAWETLR